MIKDIIKWSIIIGIAAIAFYTVYPKYVYIEAYVDGNQEVVHKMFNKITGKVIYER